MLKLHCLAYSRALRVVWLLEDLGQPYELVTYDRTSDFLAPDSLKAIHPLGKSPVIEDGDLLMAESSAILRYVHATYGDGRYEPAPGTPAFWEHAEWLDFAESSASMPILSAVFAKVAGKEDGPDDPRMKAELAKTLGYIAERVSNRPVLMGEAPMLADIQMSYMLALSDVAGCLDDRSGLSAYWQRLQDQPGFRAATAKAGPMTPPIG